MRLSLILIACAALFGWASIVLQREADGSVVAPAQRGVDAGAPTPTPRELEAHAPDGAYETGPPLFRPAQAPAPPGPAVGESFALVGLTGAGDVRIALLRDAADQQSFRVREGESVREWRVAEINERCVALVRGRRRQSICLS
jgi:hypothetical protein